MEFVEFLETFFFLMFIYCFIKILINIMEYCLL